MIVGLMWAGVLGATVFEVAPGTDVEVDLGLVMPGAPVIVDAQIHSRHSETWHLPESDVSCPACVDVVEWPRVLRPQERGVVQMVVTPGAEPGAHAWWAAFHGAAAPLRVSCRGVVPGLSVRPSQVRFGQCALGVRTDASVEVEWFGPGRLVSTTWHSLDPAVSVVPADGEAAGCGQNCGTWIVRLEGEGNASREIGAMLKLDAVISTDEGTRTIVKHEVPLHGRLDRSDLRISPPSLFLGTVRSAMACEGTVHIAGLDEEIEASIEGCVGMRVHCVDAQGSRYVNVRFEPQGDVAGCVRGTIVLRAAGAEGVLARIPVIAYVRAGGKT